AHQTLAPNHSRPEDGHIRQILAPDQAVMPVTVPEVLILIPLVWLRRIVSNVLRRLGRDNRGALVEIKSDFALETNRNGKVIARRKVHRAPAGRSRRVDRPVDRWGVKCLAVGFGAEGLDVVKVSSICE